LNDNPDKMAPKRGTRTMFDLLGDAQEELNDAVNRLRSGDQSALPESERAMRTVAGIVKSLRIYSEDKQGPFADAAGGDHIMDRAHLG